jgi:hypothetical protein
MKKFNLLHSVGDLPTTTEKLHSMGIKSMNTNIFGPSIYGLKLE